MSFLCWLTQRHKFALTEVEAPSYVPGLSAIFTGSYVMQCKRCGETKPVTEFRVGGIDSSSGQFWRNKEK